MRNYIYNFFLPIILGKLWKRESPVFKTLLASRHPKLSQWKWWGGLWISQQGKRRGSEVGAAFPGAVFCGVCFPLLHVRREHICICECRQDAIIRKAYGGSGFYWLQVTSPHLAERVGWLLSEPLPASRGRRRVQGKPRPLAAPSSTSGDFITRKRGGNGSQPLPRSLAYFLLLPCMEVPWAERVLSVCTLSGWHWSRLEFLSKP